MKILYTSDIHANPEHLFSMLNVANKEAVDAVVVGGDIVPHYLPDADPSGAALLENGKWAVIQKKGRLVAIVLEADSRDLAAQLLNNVRWKH